jgi:hypothetical protein
VLLSSELWPVTHREKKKIELKKRQEQKMDGLGIPPDHDDDLLFGLVPSWSTAVLASAVGLAGIAIWRRYLAPPGPARPTTKGTAPAGTTRPAVPAPKGLPIQPTSNYFINS